MHTASRSRDQSQQPAKRVRLQGFNDRKDWAQLAARNVHDPFRTNRAKYNFIQMVGMQSKEVRSATSSTFRATCPENRQQQQQGAKEVSTMMLPTGGSLSGVYICGYSHCEFRLSTKKKQNEQAEVPGLVSMRLQPDGIQEVNSQSLSVM